MIAFHFECDDCGLVISPVTHKDHQCSADEGGAFVNIGGTWRCIKCDKEWTGGVECSNCDWYTDNWEDYGHPVEMDESEL